MAAERAGRRDLTPEQHARIRLHLALIPVYGWLIFGWFSLVRDLPLAQSTFESAARPSRDFAHFYVQAVVAKERDAAALYDMDGQSDTAARVLPGGHRARYPPVYGPQVSAFFSPLAQFGYNAALYIWLGLSALAYAACSYAVWRACPRLRDKPRLVALLLIASPAFHFVLGFSQISAIGLVCVTAAFFALRANRPFLAGLAIGSLAYKPPLGLAAAFVFVGAAEWRIVIGAAIAAAAQIAAGVWYWGWPILPGYLKALRQIPDIAAGMEPYKYHMHSWRAFFDLLGLTGGVSLGASTIASLATLVLALASWRARGPLVLRYSALLIATVLVDPHLYAYDLLLLTPAFLLLWDWSLTIGEGSIEQVIGDSTPRRWRNYRFSAAFLWLLYLCYYAPLLGIFAEHVRIQISVLALCFLAIILAVAARSQAQQFFAGQ